MRFLFPFLLFSALASAEVIHLNPGESTNVGKEVVVQCVKRTCKVEYVYVGKTYI